MLFDLQLLHTCIALLHTISHICIYNYRNLLIRKSLEEFTWILYVAIWCCICIKRQCSCRSANFSPSIIYLTSSIQHQPECAKHKAKKSFETRGSLPIWHKRIEHFLPGNEILAVFFFVIGKRKNYFIKSRYSFLSLLSWYSAKITILWWCWVSTKNGKWRSRSRHVKYNLQNDEKCTYLPVVCPCST